MAIMVLASVVFFGLALREAVNDSPTFDEPINIAAGVTYLTRHDIRLNLEHPPLAKAIEALPVLFAHPDIPDGASWDTAPYSSFEFDFYAQNVDDIQRITTLSRLMPIMMAIGVAWVLYAIGVRLASRRVGVIAGVAWLTTPLVLGHGHLAGLDVPFALTVAITALLLLRYREHPTALRAAFVGIGAGSTLLVRTTGLLVVPVFAVALLFASEWRPNRRAVLHCVVVLVLAWATLWAGYRAISPNPSAQVHTAATQLVTCPGCSREKTIVDGALDHLAVPFEFRAGIRIQNIFSSVDHGGFLLGRQVLGHVWWFWPGSLLVKLSTPALLLVVAFPFGWRFVPRRRREFLLALGFPVAALALATVAQAPPVGVRYLLPAIALALVGGAIVLDRVLTSRWVWALALPILLGMTQLVSFGDSVSNSVAWTSWPFRPGYRFAADSNLDWAQDIDSLRAWAPAHHARVLFESPLIVLQPIEGSEPLLGVDPEHITGWVAVGASSLTVYRRDELAWLRGYCPVGTIGGTVLLYNFEQPPENRPAGDQPVGPCFDSEFSQRRD